MMIINLILIIIDFIGVDCVVIFVLLKFDFLLYCKGRICFVILGVVRIVLVEEGKKGFVRVEEGRGVDVRCLLGKLEVLGGLMRVEEGKCCV